jgi:hypothetical protein
LIVPSQPSLSGDAAMQMQIECEIPDDLHSLTTDLDRLGQVFINLISNAKKYCDVASPKLKISAHQSGSDVIIDFVDNGIGIPAQDRDFIFEKFARVGSKKQGVLVWDLPFARKSLPALGGKLPIYQGIVVLHSACRFPLISIRLKPFNTLLCALSFSELYGEFPFCLRIIKPFYDENLSICLHRKCEAG